MKEDDLIKKRELYLCKSDEFSDLVEENENLKQEYVTTKSKNVKKKYLENVDKINDLFRKMNGLEKEIQKSLNSSDKTKITWE